MRKWICLSERMQAAEKEKIQDFDACLEKCDRKMRFELVTGKLLSEDWKEIRENIEQVRDTAVPARDA